MKNTILEIDLLVNSYFQSIWTQRWKEIFDFIAWMWDFWGVVILSLPFYLFLAYKKRYLKIIAFTSWMLISVGISTLMKHTFQRARPENMIVDYGGYSFVSGHATMAVVFYWLLLFFLLPHITSRTVKNLFILFAISMVPLIILSRLYLSVHWLSDVIAWSILWSVCVLATMKVYAYYKAD